MSNGKTPQNNVCSSVHRVLDCYESLLENLKFLIIKKDNHSFENYVFFGDLILKEMETYINRTKQEFGKNLSSSF